MEPEVLARLLEEEGRDNARRLYAHQDYFSYIIPSTWFVIGVAILGLVFYPNNVSAGISALRKTLLRFGEPTTAIDLLAGVVILVMAFNTIYVLGHMLNGFASAFLERVIVRKLLRYPFQLYDNRLQRRDEQINDGDLFREAVIDAPYQVHCANILPLALMEITCWAFSRSDAHSDTWIREHAYQCALLCIVLTIAHLGLPKPITRSRLARRDRKGRRTFRWLFGGHIVVIVLASATLATTAIKFATAGVLFALPITNVALGVIDHRLRIRGHGRHRNTLARRLFLYLRYTFVNFIYFGAKMVGYAASPSVELIARAKEAANCGAETNDFYWLSYLRLQKESPAFFETAYHAMSIHSMNRNLSNATLFILIASITAFATQWPTGLTQTAFLWALSLWLCSYLFFVRYLYLLSGEHSRFVLRACALLAERDKRLVVPA